jgi:hypothetical protein
MPNKKKLLLLCSAILLSIYGCKQSDPPEPTEKGDLYFSGYYWNFKNSGTNMMGPGPNYFASDTGNIYVDGNGMLHMKITKENNKWYCSELISVKEFGYGTYMFTTQSDLTTLNEKAVLGLFSWNDYSFQTQANSEVDVEFARWGNASDSLLLTYSVQPVWFDNPSPYVERTRRPLMPASKLKTTCTHVFKWTPDTITWNSYEGDYYPGLTPMAEWKYDKSNTPRTKMEGNQVSNPIVIPAPADSTNARINLWLLNGQAPANGSETEVVIKSFKYFPL